MSDGGSATAPASGFVGVLRQREFRLLWLADLQSMLGDQFARVALSVLVFDQTRSGLATASVYALTFLPALVGGVLLGPLADRLPRRALLVAGDLIRAALLATMATVSLPIPVLAALLVVAVLMGTPWKAAQSALVVDILPTQDYPMGLGLRSATSQAAQLGGFAIGGITVAAVGAHAALGVDAATFMISAVVIRLGIHDRPLPAGGARMGGTPRRWLSGATTVFGDQRLRLLLAFSWLLGLLVIPEGLAAPYAQQLGGGPPTVGLLLTVGPTGVLIGTLVYTRVFSATTRAQLLGPSAIAAGLPLLGCALTPGLVTTCLLWAASGACTGYQVQVVTEFATTIDPGIRGQGFAIASAGLLGAQGIGLLAGGLVTQITSPTTAVAAAGATATLLATTLTAARRRHREHPPA
jgi:predicted MFS family arabinose efflux permease